jgi:Glycosyl hydrolase family 26
MTHQNSRRQKGSRRRLVVPIAAVVAAAAIAAGIVIYNRTSDPSEGPLPVSLPAATGSYLGVYASGVPNSYSGVTSFSSATGAKPDVLMYYSGWYESFKTSFATTAAENGAVPLVQIDPENVSVAAIASGRYDGYLSSYAEAVRAYRHPVILSFGHEMNGTWYSWGAGHSSPEAFVAAWRHIVTLFHDRGARNVTWLWTVNVVEAQAGIPAPGPWWPGKSYVTWVGIDGYYLQPSSEFAALFGPTVTAVRELTRDPILIAETSVVPAAGQPERIADLFAGVRRYGLLGLVWFNDVTSYDYRITSPAAIAAFRRAAKTYIRPTP